MKANVFQLSVILLIVNGLSTYAADPFDCGSTGAYGAMNITQDTTLDMPTNGIFHCTTITVASGATLTFNRNPLNTPVYLLATGDFIINGTIDVSGNGRLGGPGGFDGGHVGSVFFGMEQNGDGQGPGAGKINGNLIHAAFATGNDGNNDTYGNILCCPIIGGSGGAADNRGDGSGGGGAILITSNTKVIVNGNVTSACKNCVSGRGSGGCIRIVAPVVGGNGSLYAYSSEPGEGRGKGRVRIDCKDDLTYRSLTIKGLASRGWSMFVFPLVVPRLDIIEAMGQPISEGITNGVNILLSKGASTNQTVKIQARNFTNDVPIRVVVTPENGPSGQFDATILQSSGNPPFANVNVVIPAGSVCKIHAWTR